MLRLTAIALILAGGASPSTIQGDYIESRTCDVWTGPCFANGEINIRGKEAVLAWAVRKGTFEGVALDGLNVVAVVSAEGTIHTDKQGAVKAALYVDDRADARQREALLGLARGLAPDHLKDIVKVEAKPISFARDGFEGAVTVGNLVTVRTQALCECDAICCNEEMAYPPVSGGVQVECAKTVENEYRGDVLGSQWSDPEKRSAMVGTFSR